MRLQEDKGNENKHPVIYNYFQQQRWKVFLLKHKMSQSGFEDLTFVLTICHTVVCGGKGATSQCGESTVMKIPRAYQSACPGCFGFSWTLGPSERSEKKVNRTWRWHLKLSSSFHMYGHTNALHATWMAKCTYKTRAAKKMFPPFTKIHKFLFHLRK